MEHDSFKQHLFGQKGVIYSNLKLKPQARVLRKTMTNAEKLLWSHIRKKQLGNLQFYRQRIIGSYIVDFYCPRSKLVVEVDGSHHFEDDVAGQDRVRDHDLNNLGIQVLRFTNHEVLKNIDHVLNRIIEKL